MAGLRPLVRRLWLVRLAGAGSLASASVRPVVRSSLPGLRPVVRVAQCIRASGQSSPAVEFVPAAAVFTIRGEGCVYFRRKCHPGRVKFSAGSMPQVGLWHATDGHPWPRPPFHGRSSSACAIILA